MLKTLPQVLRINATGVWIPGLVAVSFSEYLQSNLNAMRTLAGDDEPDYASLGPLLKQWFTEFCRYDYGEANRMRLLPLFCGVAACTVFFGGETVNPPKVKQNLETFVRRTLNADEWLEFADDALGTPPFAALDEQMQAKVLEGALTLAESLATRQELEELVVAVFSGSANALKFPRHKGVYRTLDLLHRNLIRSKKKNRIFGILGVAVNPFESKIGCPACNERLNDLDFMNQLTRDGVAIHTPNCNKPIFVGLSRETLVAARIPAWAYGYTDD
ncbi:hypothetical protein BPA30113_07483 [Burkholderia paludis]|uniref:Uncharacterized protein n=2 Tax=Burkholderiaceae TaxID=119060 RepID=A0A6P2SWW9_9BURK|nr:hypothetical protein LMG30113_07446 [Burkholderia paludis]VWC48034.1 hypothetical protein BPA30113_07483 [Burkholderia paludis]